jgi:hypothetical protein
VRSTGYRLGGKQQDAEQECDAAADQRVEQALGAGAAIR